MLPTSVSSVTATGVEENRRTRFPVKFHALGWIGWGRLDALGFNGFGHHRETVALRIDICQVVNQGKRPDGKGMFGPVFGVTVPSGGGGLDGQGLAHHYRQFLEAQLVLHQRLHQRENPGMADSGVESAAAQQHRHGLEAPRFTPVCPQLRI